MVFAGGETTEKGLATTLRNLLAHPEVLAAVRQDLSLLPRAIAESFRYTAPTHMVPRQTREEVRVSGGLLPAGAEVIVRKDGNIYFVDGTSKAARVLRVAPDKTVSLVSSTIPTASRIATARRTRFSAASGDSGPPDSEVQKARELTMNSRKKKIREEAVTAARNRSQVSHCPGT